MKNKIQKKHIGHPVDFQTRNGIANGKIIKVARGIATVEYYLPANFNAEPYTTYIETTSERIVEVY